MYCPKCHKEVQPRTQKATVSTCLNCNRSFLHSELLNERYNDKIARTSMFAHSMSDLSINQKMR